MRPTNLLLFLVLVLLVAAPAAAKTTEVQVIRYAVDGSTVLNSTTVNVSWMERHLPVFGDGATPYLMQGAILNITDNSDPAIWNPAEDQEIDKINDTVRGTTVKDLCDLVGGMRPGDEVKIAGADGYGVRLGYDNVYTPQARQGPPFLAWWGAIKLYDYAPGLRLIFGADTSVNPYGLHVFGNQDMKETLDEKYWGWYGGEGARPSAAQLSIRDVAKISIYPPSSGDWTLALDGAISRGMTRSSFEQGLTRPGYRGNYTDGNGVWEGMPLWQLVGYVDDGIDQGDQAFNRTLVDEGYVVRVIAADGYNRTFTSQEVAFSPNYIVANTLNGTELPQQINGRNVWPLRLVGANATGGKSIANITGIRVEGVPDVTPTPVVTPTPTPAGANWTLKMTGYTDFTVTSGYFAAAMSCGGHTDTYTDTNGVTWTGLPLWRLIGLVDDQIGHEVLVGAYNMTLAEEGYTIRVIARDGYNRTFTSQEVNRSHGYLVASTMNGSALPVAVNGRYIWPLKLVGANATGGKSIGNITEIRLEGLPIAPAGPEVLFNGSVILHNGTFVAAAYNSNATHPVGNLTAHGALQAASAAGGFPYIASDKKWADLGTFLLDGVSSYRANKTVNTVWAYTLNGAAMNDFSADQGISVQPVADGDNLVFYFGVRGTGPGNATAVVRIRVVVANATPESGGPYNGPHVLPTVIEAEDFDKGGEGVAYHDLEPANLANNNHRAGEGVDIETENGVTNVAYVRSSEYLEYTVDATTAGSFTLILRASNPETTTKAVRVYLDGVPAGEVLVAGTGSWTTYREFSSASPVTVPAGRHVVTLAFVETEVNRLNLDWLRLVAGTVPATTTTTAPGSASFTAAPNPVAKSAMIRFTLIPAPGKTVRSAWWTFDTVNHYSTWNSRSNNPAFYYPKTGSFTPLVKVTYTDGTTETVERAGYVTVR